MLVVADEGDMNAGFMLCSWLIAEKQFGLAGAGDGKWSTYILKNIVFIIELTCLRK